MDESENPTNGFQRTNIDNSEPIDSKQPEKPDSQPGTPVGGVKPKIKTESAVTATTNKPEEDDTFQNVKEIPTDTTENKTNTDIVEKKADKKLHSIEKFPPDAKKIVERDVEYVKKFNTKLESKIGELEQISQKTKQLLNKSSDYDKTLDENKSPEDQELFDDLYGIKDIFIQKQTAEEDLSGHNRVQTYENLLLFTEKYDLVNKGLADNEKLLQIKQAIKDLKSNNILNKLKQLGGKLLKRNKNIPDATEEKDQPEVIKALAFAIKNDILVNKGNSTLTGETNISAKEIISNLINNKDQDKFEVQFEKFTTNFTSALQTRRFLWSIEDMVGIQVNKLEISNLPLSSHEFMLKKINTEVHRLINSNQSTIENNAKTFLDNSQEGKGGDLTDIGSSKLLKIIWTPTELNDAFYKTAYSINTYNKTVDSILNNIDPKTKEYQLNSTITNIFRPFEDKDYKELEAVSTQLANSNDILYHGTTLQESRKNILSTKRLLSRKRQQSEQGSSNFAVRESAIKVGLTPKSEDHEQEQICFSVNKPALQYATNNQSEGIFYVALPAHEVYRNYGFFELDGLHAFNKVNPKEGFAYDFSHQPGVIAFDENAQKNIERKIGSETINIARSTQGENIYVDSNITSGVPHGKVKNENFEIIKSARVVPTGILMDTPAKDKAGMVFELAY